MVRIGCWGGTALEATPRPGDDLIDWGDSWGDDLPDDELDGQAE
jgi:hypothetical protein